MRELYLSAGMYVQKSCSFLDRKKYLSLICFLKEDSKEMQSMFVSRILNGIEVVHKG